MKSMFAGIDSSTQSTKLVVIDLRAAKLIYTDSVNYDDDLPRYGTKNGVVQGLGEGVSESEPKMWIEAVEILMQRLKESDVPQDQIRAISVSGQQHGLVTMDADGNLTRPRSKLWNDFSTSEECDILTETVGGPEAMIEEVGNSQRTGYTAAKIFHLVRHEPEIFAKTATCFLVHNYINWYLSGGKDGGVRVMEPGDVSGMALWHPGRRQWSQKVIKAISPTLLQKLPPIKPSDQMIGRVSNNIATRFGLNPECEIDAGSGDNMYGAVGTGNVEEGLVTISLGTSGTAYTYMETPFIDPSGEIAAFCDSTGHHLPLLCVSNLANGYNAALEHFEISHEEFANIIEKTKAGNNGRLLIPWYLGERTPDVPLATPIYLGFGIDDFTKENLCRAVLEGHILNLYDGFCRLPVTPREIRLTGGLSKSTVWVQTIADIFETETIPVEGEGAALGAALHAAYVYGKQIDDQLSINQIVRPFVRLKEENRRRPRPDCVRIHNQQKQLFKHLSCRVRGVSSDQDIFSLHHQLL